jgi:plastocyanin
MRMATCLVLLLVATAAAAPEDAFANGAAAKEGALDVRVADDRGVAVADAVVSIRPRAGSGGGPKVPAARRTIDQKNLAFVPSLEVFRPGDEVVFRNSDATRHHVYSFSPAAQFEFVLAPRESSPPLRLERTGVVAVGCNIHDSMIAWLYVSDAPWIARTGRDGRAGFDGLPPGTYEVRAWHPRSKPGRAEPSRVVTVDADGTASVSFALTLLPPPRMGHGHAQY